jgi:hypothetical protein
LTDLLLLLLFAASLSEFHYANAFKRYACKRANWHEPHPTITPLSVVWDAAQVQREGEDELA